jgi:hypothetical protein
LLGLLALALLALMVRLVVFVHKIIFVAEVIFVNVDVAQRVGDGLLGRGLEVGQEALEGGCYKSAARAQNNVASLHSLHSLCCTW